MIHLGAKFIQWLKFAISGRMRGVCTWICRLVNMLVCRRYICEHVDVAVMAALISRSDDQVVRGTDCSVTVQCKALPAFYDAITGPTQFIISIINSAKIVNMP